jgi:hypothetical protein
MTTLLEEYARFVLEVGHTPELIVAGVQRIHRDVGWSIRPDVFFDGSMTLAHTGYTKNKLGALERNYYNPVSIKRAKADLAWRIKNKKYGSGAFDFRGEPKKGTKQDYCLQSCVISFYPPKGYTTVQVFWRTAELLKRFRGDILFLRDFILPHFSEEFAQAPIHQVDFRFANATFHPMYTILLVSQVPDWMVHFNRIKQHNPRLFRSMMYWGWRYVCDTSASIDSYSSARQVRVIANRVTPPDRMLRFRGYVERRLMENLDDYPKSVQSFYRGK